MSRIYLALVIVVISALACGNPPTTPRRVSLYPTDTPNPTQTPYYIIHTQTPNPTSTALVIVVTETPTSKFLCVSASEKVYLRPAPNIDNYPIAALPNGAIVADEGGRDGVWYFVSFGGLQGWVNSEYLETC